ncbi:histone acetyltransferase Spt10 [Melanomma pulvis-pyrius CBS 109.77]|uniref:Histone acetyltransferase Spt10 n=1 Tax=Melanomma pulvis-pyrius CBS 109.77 TaxID=1314802 RepID=A0A6A6WVQ7_9PLEO|nr:histone acetyltransferase Spt10 [Melanomma pulvis-pyrius CBS 109.77]
MPAMLEDPTAPVIFRTSGELPLPVPGGYLPRGIYPRPVTLRDRVTIATIVPFHSPEQVPQTLLAYLSDQLNREIEKGDTYPMIEPLALTTFGPYWFGVFGAIMLLGEIQGGVDGVQHMARSGCDWERLCLGSFYIKPNYPGRSSHVCNGGFLVTDASRNRGVGRLMGETYLEWAPRLGYTYSVFNLVYETNLASCRIWDALGFKRIGRVKACGNLKSYQDTLVDAIIYGRDLGPDDDFVSEERFEKIRFYLKNGKYPHGADRAEKSRLRSAATHYKLIAAEGTLPERLMLKGKEVVSDPQTQYEIARVVHHKNHGGINKTTATIAEQYHWVRIKETVIQVIRNCPECSEMNKGLANSRVARSFSGGPLPTMPIVPPPLNFPPLPQFSQAPNRSDSPLPQFPQAPDRPDSPSDQLQMEAAQAHSIPHYDNSINSNYEMPVDPAIMQDLTHSSNLEDLPPSPFLAAGRGLPVPQLSPLDGDLLGPQHSHLENLDLPISDLPPPISHMPSDAPAEDTAMADTEEPRPRWNAATELRRRLARAGFASSTST